MEEEEEEEEEAEEEEEGRTHIEEEPVIWKSDSLSLHLLSFCF